MSDWRKQAACLDHDPELWFPLPGQHGIGKEAKRICAACPVANECATEANRLQIQHGIWGGKSRNEASAPSPKDWLQPCGTAAAFRRHHRNGENACEPCLAANRRATAERHHARYLRSVERRANRA